MFDSSKESVELFCVHAREKLTNSIRLQWRKLRNHVERLDSQGIVFKPCRMDTRKKKPGESYNLNKVIGNDTVKIISLRTSQNTNVRGCKALTSCFV